LSRALSLLLEAKEPEFSHLIRDWEAKVGKKGHDIQLVAEVSTRAKRVIAELGLDEDDTTPKELYYALLDRVNQDSNDLAKRLGVSGEDSAEQMVQKIATWYDSLELEKELWVIKESTIKACLKKTNPKQFMKALGFRSVDSMLKRCDPSIIITLSKLIEKPDWQIKFRSEYKKLKPINFHPIQARVHVVGGEQRLKLERTGFRTSRVVSACYETGAIVVIPPRKRFSSDVLSVATSLIETTRDMRRYSAYFRLISTESRFGSKVADACNFGLNQSSAMHYNFHWNPIHRHLLGNSEYMNRIEQPHLTHADLRTSSSVEVLARGSERFKFWQGNEFVLFAAAPHKPVSVHLADVAINASNHSGFEVSLSMYARSQLWEELWANYLSHQVLHDEVVGSFFDQNKL
jgi:hypothetical protein